MGFYNEAMHDGASVSATLTRLIRTAIERNGGWLPFDRFMAMALYAPGLGYYANRSRKFGTLPESGSDFVTAPELSPLFGAALARQLAQALKASDTNEIWEFGAGSGALAEQLLGALAGLGQAVRRYTIVDLSGALRERQRERLAPHGATVQWVDELPDRMTGIVVGNVCWMQCRFNCWNSTALNGSSAVWSPTWMRMRMPQPLRKRARLPGRFQAMRRARRPSRGRPARPGFVRRSTPPSRPAP